MSNWTYVNGTIEVSTLGRTQEEIEYILKTVLRHLPKVTGSEQDMHTYLIKKEGYSSSYSHDEFEHWVKDFDIQDNYIIVVDGSLRDRTLNETHKEFQKWICRLAKRVLVENVIVEIKENLFSDVKSIIISDTLDKYSEMYEYPSWSKGSDGEPNWCEYLLWRKRKNSPLPTLLEYKYYENKENDEIVEEYLSKTTS